MTSAHIAPHLLCPPRCIHCGPLPALPFASLPETGTTLYSPWNVNPVVLMCGRVLVCLFSLFKCLLDHCVTGKEEGRMPTGQAISGSEERANKACWLLLERVVALEWMGGKPFRCPSVGCTPSIPALFSQRAPCFLHFSANCPRSPYPWTISVIASSLPGWCLGPGNDPTSLH